MALPRSFTRLDLPTQQTVGEGLDRESLLALSQRKLNALGLPVCYIDVDQRYRFVNRAFLDWSGKPQSEVIGREVVEVDGRELYQLYHAYLEAALNGEGEFGALGMMEPVTGEQALAQLATRHAQSN